MFYVVSHFEENKESIQKKTTLENYAHNIKLYQRSNFKMCESYNSIQ